jgi:hypothetical protein
VTTPVLTPQTVQKALGKQVLYENEYKKMKKKNMEKTGLVRAGER